MRILFAIIALMLVISASAQDTKKMLRINATMNNQHPDKFAFEDSIVKITLKDYQLRGIDYNIYNKSDNSIDIVWQGCYFVIDGDTQQVDNLGVSKTAVGMFGTASVDNMKDQKIGSKATFIAKMGVPGFPFGEIAAKKHYKSTGETLVNRVVITLRINGELKEYPITIELYTKEDLKKSAQK